MIPLLYAQYTAFAYHASLLTSLNLFPTAAFGLPAGLHRNVTHCARVQAWFGPNVVADVPVVIPSWYAQSTAFAYHRGDESI